MELDVNLLWNMLSPGQRKLVADLDSVVRFQLVDSQD
jgi:hypothetical protein